MRTREIAGPSRYMVHNLDTTELARLTESLAGQTGRRVYVANEAASRVLRSLPHIARAAEALPVFVPPVDIRSDRYDLGSNTWQEASVDQTGGFRFFTKPVRYAATTPAGWRLTDNRIAKALAACSERQPFIAYEPDTETLVCRLGARLPGLYERAAVLCSGELPVDRQNGTVTYAHVPERIAAGLWARLSSAS